MRFSKDESAASAQHNRLILGFEHVRIFNATCNRVALCANQPC